jgi:hypothetical protein
MTTHATQYKLANAERQKRMDEFAQTDQPTALAAELAAARLMAEESMNAGHYSLASALLQTIGKLGAAHTASQYRLGEMLEKEAIMRLGKQLVDLVCGVIKERFVGWEEALDQLSSQVVVAIEQTRNDPGPKLLEGPK